jgi:hypothetical protein
MNPQFLYPSQDFPAGRRGKEIKNAFSDDWPNFGDDAVLFRFAFGSLGKPGLD